MSFDIKSQSHPIELAFPSLVCVYYSSGSHTNSKLDPGMHCDLDKESHLHDELKKPA
jgi:hypothetical protein